MSRDTESGQEAATLSTIVFDEEALCERGTSIAVYDYARALRRLAHVHPIVVFDEAKTTDRAVIAKFEQDFEIRPYQGIPGRRRLVERVNPDLYYYLKLQAKDDRWFEQVPVATHIVFDLRPNPRARNAYISGWLSSFMTRNSLPVVPHIVTLPPPSGDYRSTVDVPADAVVIGRHGGEDTFDIEFVHRAVLQALEARPDLWFVFVNTRRFTDHPRAVFRPAIHDRQGISNFVAACDAMIHGRARGESFGLAMAEFLFHNRPVYCWGGGRDRNHVALQPAAGNVYWTRHDLRSLLLKTRRWSGDMERSDGLSLYSEEIVCRSFMDTFVAPIDFDEPLARKFRSHELGRRFWNRASLMRDRVLASL